MNTTIPPTPQKPLRLSFKVAEACFRVTFPNRADSQALTTQNYAPFRITDNDETEFMFTMTVNSTISTTEERSPLIPFEATGKTVGEFDCGGAMHNIYNLPNGGYRILIRDIENREACAFDTTADFSTNKVTLYGDIATRTFGLNNALMIAYAFAGAHHDILLMHSSVTMNSGRGYMFLGKSGTGKSTHSSLWRKYIAGSDLLNDDNPAIRVPRTTNEATVYGTPWSGKTPCYRNLSQPIGAIVRLEQWPKNIIRRESRLQAFASILSSCSTMMWDKPSYDAILATVSRAAKRVPVFYLQCLPDEEAAQMCHEAVTNIKH